MYNVLIVDDEPLILQILKTKIPWSQYEMLVIGEATDGYKALDFLEKHKVDIVFTDIKMPHLDGNSFIMKAQSLYPDIKFIVLSSYSDYPLVRKAFVAGAKDYILKIDIDSSEFLKLLERIQAGIYDEIFNSSNKPDIKKDILKILDTNNCNISKDQLDRKKIRVISIYYKHNNYSDLIVNIKQLQQRYQIIYLDRKDELCLIYCYKNSIEKANYDNLLNDLHYCFFNHSSHETFIGISSMGTFDEFNKLYLEATKASHISYYYDIKTISFYKTNNDYNKSISIIKNQINDLISQINFKDLSYAIRNYLNKIESTKLDKEKVTKHVSDIFLYVVNRIFDIGLLPSEIQNNSSSISNTLNSFNKFNDLKKWIYDQINIIQKNIDNKYRYDPVDIIKIYMEHNFYTDPSLNDVAKLFGISKSHLSRIFTKNIGISFKEYLNTLKIEKAKNYLINTDLKIYEICEKVGYSNMEHFSRIFKKVVGVSPTQYKNSVG